MTPAEIARLLQVLTKRWPHAPLPTGSGDVWLDDLKELPAEECMAAVTRWAKAGERFPPTSGWVCSDVDRQSQAPVPPWELVGDLVGRSQHWLPYDPDGRYSPADTAEAVRVLAERGLHEVILRFVQERGFGCVFKMKWPGRSVLDPSESADHRDLARHFRDVTIPGWRADPTPGLALVRARESLGRGAGGELRQIDPSCHLPEASGE